jgi:hypothetical protein
MPKITWLKNTIWIVDAPGHIVVLLASLNDAVQSIFAIF